MSRVRVMSCSATLCVTKAGILHTRWTGGKIVIRLGGVVAKGSFFMPNGTVRHPARGARSGVTWVSVGSLFCLFCFCGCLGGGFGVFGKIGAGSLGFGRK